MKILFITSLYHPNVGGIETMVRELSRTYIKKGNSVVILTKKWPNRLPEYDEYEGIKIYRIISAKTESEFIKSIKFLKKNIKELQSDVIHVIGVRRPLPLMGFILSRYCRVPLITTIAGGDVPDPLDPEPGKIWAISKKIVEPVIIRSDCLNALSKDLVSLAKKTIPEVKKVGIIYAGLDVNEYKSVSKHISDIPYVVSVRRLDVSKGVDITVKAFAEISKNFKDIKLIIIGDGPELKRLRSLAIKLKIINRVEFKGTLSLEESLSYLKGALFTVVPSRSEGGGLINLEAQACGCPLITSRVGGIKEYAKEGFSAIMFNPERVDDLSKKMKILILDKKLRNKLAKNGKEFIKSFDWSLLSEEYLEIYAKLRNKEINFMFQPWSNLISKLWMEMQK